MSETQQVGRLGMLIERIEKFIDDTPLTLGWRIAEAVEVPTSAIVDREYVEWLHVRAFLRDVLDSISESSALPPAPPQAQEPLRQHVKQVLKAFDDLSVAEVKAFGGYAQYAGRTGREQQALREALAELSNFVAASPPAQAQEHQTKREI